MDIKRRLDALQQAADKTRPCHMTVSFADGSETVTDPVGAWDICFNHIMREDVASVTADRPEYAAVAGIMTVLCHPIENRRIEDYA